MDMMVDVAVDSTCWLTDRIFKGALPVVRRFDPAELTLSRAGVTKCSCIGGLLVLLVRVVDGAGCTIDAAFSAGLCTERVLPGLVGGSIDFALC